MYFNWTKKYAGMVPLELQRLSELRKIVADLSLDEAMLQDVIK